uniref:Ig-like domain-containing protein n=1 Tax=Scleropages formosus TaxID=113540 RepID=A0A8C9QWE1_SCLFO
LLTLPLFRRDYFALTSLPLFLHLANALCSFLRQRIFDIIHPSTIKDPQYMYWFKFLIGQTPDLVATSHKYATEASFSKNFNSSRFMVKLGTGINHLIITKIEWSDSAMYYCVTRSDYSIHFGAGTFLWIKGSKKQQFNTRTVVQQLVSDPVYPGDSVTLQCTVDRETCSGEHSVYWFRHGSGESLPGFIYTHGNRSDECEKSPEAGSPTHGCVYSLPKRNLSRSDAGIYYCAVLTCGDILFGNGTQLDIEGVFKNSMYSLLSFPLLVLLLHLYLFIYISIVGVAGTLAVVALNAKSLWFKSLHNPLYSLNTRYNTLMLGSQHRFVRCTKVNLAF